eukprot:1358903-Ditylum_brightwellii.AAC.1
MDVLSLYAKINFANLALDLLQDSSNIIAMKSILKFIPMSLKYDKMIKDNTGHYTTLLREQNAYLVNYAHFCAGSLSETMFDFKISGTTVKDNIHTSPYIINIHETTYTETKGIWTIEMMVEDLHKVLKDVETSLEVIPE